MAYIARYLHSNGWFRNAYSDEQIAVNASILSDTGGPCVCPTADLCVSDDVYLACVAEVRRDFITTTAAISALASFLMGVFANLPVGLAPGLGLNAYVSFDFKRSVEYWRCTAQFAYSVVGFHGSGIITYGEALSAVFLEGYVYFYKHHPVSLTIFPDQDGCFWFYPCLASVNGWRGLCPNP